jgi:regulatory protein
MPRRPPPVTEARLRDAADRYVARYASSAAHLRRLLRHKVRRSVADHETDGAAAERWVEATIAALSSRGALDDQAYARMTAERLWRQGKALASIRRALRTRGVGADAANAAVERLAAETSEPDLVAAVALARRRRLGPYRVANRATFRQRDLAALARAGFSLAVAKRVVDAVDPEALSAALALTLSDATSAAPVPEPGDRGR